MSLFQTMREDLQVESQQKRKHDEISDKRLKGQSLLLTMMTRCLVFYPLSIDFIKFYHKTVFLNTTISRNHRRNNLKTPIIRTKRVEITLQHDDVIQTDSCL